MIKITKVGIPRALLYYYYYPLWHEFFTRLGCEVVLSPETNKAILDQGIKSTLSEVCLPVKVYFGHVAYLAGRVDYLFVPRITRVEAKAYICPKFMGIPDMLKARIKGLPPLIDTTVDAGKKGNYVQCWVDCLRETGKRLTADRKLIDDALEAALQAQRFFRKRLHSGMMLPDAIKGIALPEIPVNSSSKPLRIGLIGHPYNIYDPFISMNLIKKLQQLGAVVVTPESLEADEIEKEAARLPKRLFWTLGKRMIGSAFRFFSSQKLDGVIYLTSFGCGPEALVEELVARIAKQQNMPLMMLTIDEHTGEAGINTRLEAFTEMIVWRLKYANHIPPYGESVHCR
ncbi:MAG: acyl-CoA dehydratase activase-related protein [Acetomicrobium sp.]